MIWSCTNCGACVEECPVDIEHIDHIDGMRRHQVLIESAFPVEAAGMLRNLENKGDPWGMGEMRRAEWITELDFEVPVVDGKIDPEIEYLFWVGCAGALEDRAKKTTKAIATLLHTAGVKFAVLGPAETCTGDPARRIGNEFVFSMLAQQNVETLNEAGAEEGRGQLPALLQHHLPRVPAAGRELRGHPPHPAAGPAGRRGPPPAGHRGGGEAHLPRPVLPGPAQQGVHPAARDPGRGARRRGDRRCTGARSAGFCCGAGGARMWMEERIGKRINTERIEEALALEPDTISTACPYCLVMLGDAVAAKKSSGDAPDTLEVVDVAQLLARSVRSTAPAVADGDGGTDGAGAAGS